MYSSRLNLTFLAGLYHQQLGFPLHCLHGVQLVYDVTQGEGRDPDSVQHCPLVVGAAQEGQGHACVGVTYENEAQRCEETLQLLKPNRK